MRRKQAGTQREKGKFERFWNRLFTYAYDCDNIVTLLVNETFFIASALVLTWLCSLATGLGVPFLGWLALIILVLGDMYLIVSFYVAIQTFALKKIRKRKAEKASFPAESVKKPSKKEYKISNKRL